ncbi:hypothetical protein B0T09DRAFT_66924 [Sordaria sp. MPI-SDFR-AT-0083]|nr:hypothetical protein B0T09DRAFT_66924 [Sordaria sp. MPI-SDFR-AT-0083]
MTIESLIANDPLLGEPRALLQVLHNLLALCGRAHPTPPSICTFAAVNRPRSACLQELQPTVRCCRIDLETLHGRSPVVAKYLDQVTQCWQITLGHLHGTHTCPAQASQPASPPCLQAYQSHHQGFPQIGDKISLKAPI